MPRLTGALARRVCRGGAYIVPAAESRPVAVDPRTGPRPSVAVTDEDRKLAAVLLARQAGRA